MSFCTCQIAAVFAAICTIFTSSTPDNNITQALHLPDETKDNITNIQAANITNIHAGNVSTYSINDDRTDEEDPMIKNMIKKIIKYAKYIALGLGVFLLVILFCWICKCCCHCCGFTERGVRGHSAASNWQSNVGNVEQGSVFSRLQSRGARGYHTF